jgi:predicted DNA-binding transcriptional regulator AlpA
MFSYRTNRPPHKANGNSQANEPLSRGDKATERIVGGRSGADFAGQQFSRKVETLLSIRDVRQRLGVGNTTIWKLIEEERLEKVKLRRRSFVTESSVDRLIAELVEEARRKREASCE